MARAVKAPATKKSERVECTPTQSIHDALNRMQDSIRRRAYELFDRDAARFGNPVDNWFRAEQELCWSPAIEIVERGGSIELKAALAGFEREDLDVQVAPEEILIRSEREHNAKTDEALIRSEFHGGKLFRNVRLPLRIDPQHAEASFRNGLLVVIAPITAEDRIQRIEIQSV